MCDLLNLEPCGDPTCGHACLFTEALSDEAKRLQRHVRDSLHNDAVHRAELEQLAATRARAHEILVEAAERSERRRRGEDVDEEPPTVPGEVIGWRAWGVTRTDDGLRLTSLYGHVEREGDDERAIWPVDDWLYARCDLFGCEVAPAKGCHCGIYAARDFEQLEGQHRYGDPKHRRYVEEFPTTVVGQVAQAGLMFPHARGWRAARARPLRLLVAYDRWRFGNELRSAYGCEVGLVNVKRKDA